MVSNLVKILSDSIEIEPLGMNKVWGFQGKLEIPVSHIKGATLDQEILQDRGMRAPGLAGFGKYVGTFRKEGEKTYFDVSHNETPVVIQLENEYYDRLVLGVENPKKVVDDINNLTVR